MVLDSASCRLSVSAWNINGLKSTLLDQKLEHADFLIAMKQMDFFAVCETWTRERDFNVPNFRCFVEPATKLRGIKCGRNSGGISLFYKECYANVVTFVKSYQHYVCCKIAQGTFNLTKDLFICAVYIPPENSPYFSQNMLEDLERDILSFTSHGHIIILGDLNARTGDYKDYIENDGSHFIQHDLSAQIQNIS